MTGEPIKGDKVNGIGGDLAQALSSGADSELFRAIQLADAGQYDDALEIFHRILEDNPDDAELLNDVGGQLFRLGKLKQAIEVLNRAIRISPDLAEAYNNLGCVHHGLNRPQYALPAFKKALSLKPQFIDPYVNLILCLKELGEYDEACTYAHMMLELPDYTPDLSPNVLWLFRCICDFEGLGKLGDVWEIGNHVEPNRLEALLLDLLVYADDDHTVGRLSKLIDRWARNVEAKAASDPLPPLTAGRIRDRLRIGFLSSDFRGHSVGKFLIKLIKNFDRECFSFHCYTPVWLPNDPDQQQFRDNVDDFVNVDGTTMREIAAKIRDDGIDILIELNGFTKWSRTAVLAYRPAPVQISWLGYPFTYGLEAIDYTIVDSFLNPANQDAVVEEPIIMPGAWICYDSFQEQPVASDLPMDRNGVVTYGTLNNPYKYTPKVIALWAEVLKQVPESRFLVVRPEVKSMNFCRNLTGHFAAEGISSDRLFFIDNKAGDASHLAYYNEIDITLDTFPLTGGTTTCDAIWMGVPVVTVVGEACHQRISYSDLMQCGLDELCTFSPQDYVGKAVSLAGERDKLLAWRHGLRDLMRASPLCDETRFVHEFQDMLRQVADLHGLRGAMDPGETGTG